LKVGAEAETKSFGSTTLFGRAAYTGQAMTADSRPDEYKGQGGTIVHQKAILHSESEGVIGTG
jgi:hypothetical protein